LIQAGVRHLVVAGVPNVGMVPEYNGVADEAARRAAATEYSAMLDGMIQQFLAELRVQYPQVTIHYASLADAAAEVVSNLEQIFAPEALDGLHNPSDILFFDKVHPNAQAHALITSFILDSISGSSAGEAYALRAPDYRIDGTIGVAGEVDRITVSLAANTTYTFEMLGLSSGSGSLADPRLRITGPAGTAGDDDGGTGLDASFRFTTAQAGDYALELAGVGSLSGSYKFQLTADSDYEPSAPITFTGGSDNDLFTGGSGDDQASGNGGDDILYGGGGNDRLHGGDGIDRLYGEHGDDVLEGGLGVDVLEGGFGSDTYVVADGDQLIEAAAAGTDTVLSSVNHTLGAHFENVTLTGTAYQAGGNDLDNVLIGNSANNRLYGAGGADRMIGGAGDDAYQVDDVRDVIAEAAGEGVDSVQSEITYRLADNVENLALVSTVQPNGQRLDQGIEGYGNGLDNRLSGNMANNILGGGAGNDTITGGAGTDRFFFNSALNALTNVDVITDFASATESIVLDRTIFTAIRTAGALDAAAFIVGTAAKDAEDRIVYDQAGGNIYYDSDGKGAAAKVLFARVTAGTVLTAANFSAVDGGTPPNYEAIGYRGGEADNYFVGGLGNDRAFGFGGKDTLIGAGGNDTLDGGLGDDRLEGGDGNDLLYGGLGADYMAGGAGDDYYEVGDAGDLVVEKDGEGIDTVRSIVDYVLLSAVENLTLGAGKYGAGNELSNTIEGNTNSNVLDGRLGNDTLSGGAGADQFVFSTALNAATNVDRITDFSVVEDTIVLDRSVFTAISATETLTASVFVEGTAARDSDDRIVYDRATGKIYYDADGSGPGGQVLFAQVTAGTALTNAHFKPVGGPPVMPAEGLTYTGDAADNVFTGGAGDDRASAFGGNDQLYGGGGNDMLDGGDGNDLLEGGEGTDTLRGGSGDDEYHVDSGDDLAHENADEGRDIVYASTSYQLASPTHVEILSAREYDSTAAITLVGNDFANIIYGNAGANSLVGGGGADSLVGLGGDDLMVGGTGSDTMYGGTGDDSYYVDDRNDVLVEQADEGRDVVYTGLSYELAAGSHVEILSADNYGATTGLTLVGNGLDNAIYGNAGANVLIGGGGNDALVGGAGDDVYHVDSSDEIYEYAGEGRDVVYTSTSYQLRDNAHVEILSAGDYGSTAALILTGNEFSNIIYGNAGANIIDGKGGSDTLVGLDGADTFAFTTALGSHNVDSIAGFEVAIDRVSLAGGSGNPFAGLGAGALSASAFTIGSGATIAGHRIVYNSQSGALYYDADGSGAGAAVLFATLAPGLNLTSTNFTVAGAPSAGAGTKSSGGMEEGIPDWQGAVLADQETAIIELNLQAEGLGTFNAAGLHAFQSPDEANFVVYPDLPAGVTAEPVLLPLI
jgi:Ca2+-binding RTX toxin-like protein